MHAQAVCTRPLLGGKGGGGEGAGDEARPLYAYLTSSYMINGKQGLTKRGLGVRLGKETRFCHIMLLC